VYDEETGLYYLRSRYYDLHQCRFINSDSIIQQNLFFYCDNNPIAKYDENGFAALYCFNENGMSVSLMDKAFGVGVSSGGQAYCAVQFIDKDDIPSDGEIVNMVVKLVSGSIASCLVKYGFIHAGFYGVVAMYPAALCILFLGGVIGEILEDSVQEINDKANISKGRAVVSNECKPMDIVHEGLINMLGYVITPSVDKVTELMYKPLRMLTKGFIKKLINNE